MSVTDAEAAPPVTSAKTTRAPWRSNARMTLGASILLAIVAVAVVVPIVSPYSATTQDLRSAFQGPSWSHPLGTDNLGRDVLVRLAVGARYTIGITVTATTVGAVIGVGLGSVVAYVGGVLDAVVMRAVDVLLAFPGVLISFMVIAVLGPGADALVYAVIVYSTPIFARLAYGTSKSISGRLFIEAARSRGASSRRIILRYVLPNITSELAILWTLRLAVTALLVSALSFVGLGVQPPAPEWGAMLSQARDYMRVDPRLFLAPGIAISLLIVAINLLGDGLRDAIDPRLRE